MVTHGTGDTTNAVATCRRTDGFTIVEIMMVVTIMGILSTILVLGFGAPLSRVKKVACYSTQRVLETAVNPYRLDHEGKDPASVADLQPYLKPGTLITCPADASVELTLDANDFSVKCPLHPR